MRDIGGNLKLPMKLLLPSALCAVGLAVFALAGPLPATLAGVDRLVLALLLLAAAGIGAGVLGLALSRYVLTPLRRLVEAHAREASPAQAADADPVARVAAQLEAQAAALERADQAIETARRRTSETRAALSESEERYELAVRGSRDGLWEWDLKSHKIYLSPRWKSMLGFGVDAGPKTVEAWNGRIHPEDAAEVEARLRAHLEGRAERFESQHRLVAQDGRIVWVLSRGAAVRHASGRPYRVVGLDSDVTPFKRMEEVLRHVAEGTAQQTGGEFFRQLVKHFALALNVHQAFITQCVDSPATRVRALACWTQGEFSNFEYELEGTPCKAVIQGGTTCFIPRDLATEFPIEEQYGLNSYLGIPIFDSRQRVVGHLAFLDSKEMDESMLLDSVYRIFTSRAAGEIERARDIDLLLQVARGASEPVVDERLETLVRSFANYMGATEAFLTECIDHEPAAQASRVRTIAYWSEGQTVANVEYEIAGTPCAEVLHQAQAVYWPKAMAQRWPLEKGLPYESYLGLPCADGSGRVIGHLACFSKAPMSEQQPDPAVLKLFTDRALQELLQRRSRPASAS